LSLPAHDGVMIGSLTASTENLGDYIQMLACLRLLERLQLRPSIYLDRDTELASAPALGSGSGPVVLPLNGWFKRTVADDPQWPPHQRIIPVFIGFHVRPHQCPALLERDSIDYMKAHGPVGCRDPFTARTLEQKGVPTYLSHCLSLTFEKRAPDERGDKIVVASRDREIVDLLPPAYRDDHVYVNHYMIRDRFSAYLAEAEGILEFYRTRARLVITTFLHCALPCIAMGIPVVAFLPRPQNDFQRISDEERFSGLAQIAQVHRFASTASVDWNPAPLDVEALKQTMVLDFQNRIAAALAAARGGARLASAGAPGMLELPRAINSGGSLPVNGGLRSMSAGGALAISPGSSRDDAIQSFDSSSDVALGGGPPDAGELDVLRNSISAIMAEHHEQSKNLADLAACHATQAQEIAALTERSLQLSQENLQLSRENAQLSQHNAQLSQENVQLSQDSVLLSQDLAALSVERDALAAAGAEAAARCAASAAETGALRAKCSELEGRLDDIESSTSWRATKRLREAFTRHPRLRRWVTTIRLTLARS